MLDCTADGKCMMKDGKKKKSTHSLRSPKIMIQVQVFCRSKGRRNFNLKGPCDNSTIRQQFLSELSILPEREIS